jgi:hypothetical protein
MPHFKNLHFICLIESKMLYEPLFKANDNYFR